jgi:hypothetical protein
MVTNCVNPACERPFHYLRGGRLYRFELRTASVCRTEEHVASKRKTVYFWMCDKCCDEFSLKLDPSHGVVLKEFREGSDQRLTCKACRLGSAA